VWKNGVKLHGNAPSSMSTMKKDGEELEEGQEV